MKFRRIRAERNVWAVRIATVQVRLFISSEDKSQVGSANYNFRCSAGLFCNERYCFVDGLSENIRIIHKKNRAIHFVYLYNVIVTDT